MFRVGERVRVNAGQFYGQVGTVTKVHGTCNAIVRLASGFRVYRLTDLLTLTANNGD